MKKWFLFLASLSLLFPLSSFAAMRENFTASWDLSGGDGTDAPYTSAWFDSFGGRFILTRDWVTRDAASTLLDNYACDAAKLQVRFAPELKTGIGCKKTSSGSLLFGFFQNPAGNFVGRIYRIDDEQKTLVSRDDIFVDSREDAFVVGVKSSDALLVVYQMSRGNKFFTFGQGVWTQLDNTDLSLLRIYGSTHIAWTGSAWALSTLGRDLKLFDGRIVSNVYGTIPGLDFYLSDLQTDLAGGGMIAFGNARALTISDNGYQGGSVIESTTTSSRSGNAIVMATLTSKTSEPSGTSLSYTLSSNNAKRWYDAPLGTSVSFGERDTKLRWQAFLKTSDRSLTPVLQGVTVSYTTEDVSIQGTQDRDRTRVGDLAQAQRYLQNYFNDIGKDPTLESSFPKKTRWDILKRILLDGARSVRRDGYYISSLDQNFPRNPNDSDAFLYDYQSDSFGTSYLLSVTLENSLSGSLQNDLDGIVLGINCNDPAYCIGQGPNISPEGVFAQKPSGALLRAIGDPRVYVIQGRAKQWVINPQVFAAHRFRWQDVQLVTVQELAQYQNGETVNQ